MLTSIDGRRFCQMVVCGANRLGEHRKTVDEMNVFPVPDGDTGTNMSMTVLSAAREVLKNQDRTVAEMGKALSSGALRGARGNSGVIVSQLFRGIYRGLRESQTVDTGRFAEALRKGVETAYKAVMRPKEGTILTVAREMADFALETAMHTEDIDELLETTIEHGKTVLEKTPDMLPVLKEAGVVDAGGQGLLYLFEGLLAGTRLPEGEIPALRSEEDCPEGQSYGPEGQSYGPGGQSSSPAEGPAGVSHSPAQAAVSEESLRYGYCTEFIVEGVEHAERQENMLREYLSGIGDSLVLVIDEDLIKVHVHTNDPGLAIQKGLSLGSLSSIKVDNMRLQHRNILDLTKETDAKGAAGRTAEKTQGLPSEGGPERAAGLSPEGTQGQTSERTPEGAQDQTPGQTPERTPERRKEAGFITIASGDGIAAVFKDLGADAIIPGGQTMNPSTEDILTAIEKVRAENVIVLPNNKNIILAAQQAAELTKDKKVHVVESKSIPQGITAMLNYAAGESMERNVRAMKDSLATVKTGQITFAVRDSHIGALSIHKGDLLAIVDGEVTDVGENLTEISRKLIDHLMEDGPELITVYAGAEADEEVNSQLKRYMEDSYPDAEVEIHKGGQPLYYYIISAE